MTRLHMRVDGAAEGAPQQQQDDEDGDHPDDALDHLGDGDAEIFEHPDDEPDEADDDLRQL